MGLFGWFSKVFGNYSDDTEGAWSSSAQPTRPTHFIGRDFIAMRPWHQGRATNRDEWLEHSNSSDLFDDHDITSEHSIASPFSSESHVNPATGLPMIGGMGGVDVLGNAYGVDMNHDDLLSDGFDSETHSGFGSGIDDSFSHSFDDSFNSSFDDSFGSGLNDRF